MKNKMSIDDFVWYMYLNKPRRGRISVIELIDGKIYYGFKDGSGMYLEELLFDSKEQLLNSL